MSGDAGDTIVALATAPGRGAIAVVRLSGAGAGGIAARVVRPWPISPRAATLCEVRASSGEQLDRALVTFYEGPRSFTGEDTVEIACHGGWVVPTSVMAALIEAGAREALPGEFTRRAVLNGKLDVLQAEAVGDLVDARSRGGQRAAINQLDGGLSRRVLALRESLLELEALIAYDIDFPEEDDGPVAPERIAGAADRTLAALDDLLATARAGELIREGALIVIAGAPNVGKSSLFNALLGRRRAIVTDTPGTTRDALEALIDAERWPIRLVDTAGLRETADVVERLGIEVSEDYLARADAVLACGDDDQTLAHAVDVIRQRTEAPVLAVRTKIDLTTRVAGRGEAVGEAVAVSAETGVGLSELVTAITTTLSACQRPPDLDAPILTHVRHRHAIQRARDELAAFRGARLDAQLPAPVAAVHLRAAVHALEELVGAVDVEDVLERVFASFCVGK
ncbi:MAG: tRNA uridine-5-carboxymethylaminomethyl(34) synthesis GTPase MnmE [Gemmatimonadota bacterium]|nr:tRNA uridine-5-carboxymethylaminomethyl(34) synthesis GTPase MnmE [Gemmatimonadota bacterium]